MKAKEQPTVTITPDDERLLIRICNVQSETGSTKRMRRFVRQLAQDYGATSRTDHGNLYITKGDATVYPCFVAHLDTVHRIRQDYAVFRYDDGDLTAGYHTSDGRYVPTGIGGDDKCGIFIALAMLRDLPACKVALFRDEENGCVGAGLADLRFFDDCQYAIECDRKGAGDMIQDAAGVELHGDGFAAAIETHTTALGYADAYGSLTDVMTLKENGLKIAACNLSAGYYDPHQAHETIRPNDVARTLDLCQRIARTTSGIVFPHEYTYTSYTSWRSHKTHTQWPTKSAGSCPTCKLDTSPFGYCRDCREFTIDPWEADKCKSCGSYTRSDGTCYICNQAPTLPASWTACPQCGNQTTYDTAERAEFCLTCFDYTYNLYAAVR